VNFENGKPGHTQKPEMWFSRRFSVHDVAKCQKSIVDACGVGVGTVTFMVNNGINRLT
jgi:hypothetical protein